MGVSLVANIGLFWAWQSARDDIAEEKAACNLETVLVELEAERIAHEATKRNHETTLNDMVAIAERERQARSLAEAGEEIAEKRAISHQQTITRLELEAEENEIPDSFACLNAFMLSDSVDGLRVSAGGCDEAGGSAGTGADQACTDSEGPDETASAFAAITYGDGLRLWQKDRHTIVQLNNQLAAIEALSENKDDQ